MLKFDAVALQFPVAIQENTDADFSVSVFLVEQIINLSNQFTNDFARVIDFSYEISAL